MEGYQNALSQVISSFWAPLSAAELVRIYNAIAASLTAALFTQTATGTHFAKLWKLLRCLSK